MNCIFICVFHNKYYINLLYLLLESIFIFGNLGDDTDILIYTSSEFMNIIKASHLFNEKIKFEINDNYCDVCSACMSRLDVFNLSSSYKYSKFLYLDVDILIMPISINQDINSIFEIATDDVLYTMEEGQIDSTDDYYGKSLFGNEIDNYQDKSAFSSGILLFNNCDKMKFLFEEINKHVSKMKIELYIIDNVPTVNYFYDQPFIIYNAFKYNVFDNKKLKQYAMNKGLNPIFEFDRIINHFNGDMIGHRTNVKYQLMKNILNIKKDLLITNIINETKIYINSHLLPIINNIGEQLEGNIFYRETITNDFLDKVKNLSNLVLNKNVRNIMEIGFNSGFSTLLFLMSNPHLKITCFDLGEHKYTIPCYEKLRETFGSRINLITGDSTTTLQNINEQFDLIHIDGGHSTEVAESDIINSYRLSKKGTIFIMDDYDFHNLHNLWDKYIKIYNLQPLDIDTNQTIFHDIKYTLR